MKGDLTFCDSRFLRTLHKIKRFVAYQRGEAKKSSLL